MANPEHVALVKARVYVPDRWMRRGPAVRLELEEADLRGADLHELILANAYLRKADLRAANLYDANLLRANLRRANLEGANLRGTYLGGVDLTGAVLDGADLSWARCEQTVFGDVDLSGVKGLADVQHNGPSIIGVDTLFRSKGKMPEEFLWGAGVPENLIEYLGSLTGTALEFYTCFISFTDADDLFSRRLYNDLQAAGVRCWRWKEDAKWGQSLWGQVDETIRLYDKLVVILSEPSLKSEPVIREIERALQKEQREGKEVLFPIRLDDAVFDWKHALQADVVRKVTGDFRQWQDPAKYDASLTRLIADLRAAPKVV